MKHLVYLHGLNCTSNSFNHIRASLPKHNATLINYDGTQHIEDSVRSVIAQMPKGEPIALVCHSLGGIIGKLVLQHPDFNITNLITISTPFGGSISASGLKWFYPSIKVLQDLDRFSPSLIEARRLSNIYHTAIVSTSGNSPLISGYNDGVVTLESQLDVNATEIVEVRANHFEILQDINTIEYISKILF